MPAMPSAFVSSISLPLVSMYIVYSFPFPRPLLAVGRHAVSVIRVQGRCAASSRKFGIASPWARWGWLGRVGGLGGRGPKLGSGR
jgi:hypothetical protein